MFKILERRELTPDIVWMSVEAPRVARAARPGQFVIVRASEKGERIPLTIADYDPEKGTVLIVTQRLGVSTRKIFGMQQGDVFESFAGPLGRPAEFVHEDLAELRNRRLLFIAGGVGTAPVYARVKWLHDRGVKVDVIVGARNAATHIMLDEMRAAAANLYIATDDGSLGHGGFVTDVLRNLVEHEGQHYDEVVAIGPMQMMRAVADVTRELGLKTTVSLNALMVDGTGMCGACRVTVGGKTLFTCVDGPEFDAHEVDFDEAIRRQGMYRNIEARAMRLEEERRAGHKCKVGLDKV